MRSLISEPWGLVEDQRGGLEAAGPGEAAMKPSREDQAAPAGGPWEECFEAAVQLALRAGQVSAAALPPRHGPVSMSAAPPGWAGTLPASHLLGLRKVREVRPQGLLWGLGKPVPGPRAATESADRGRVWVQGPRVPSRTGAAGPCGGRLVTVD